MTREKAHDEISWAIEECSFLTGEKVIDEIYDSFESRTCENCKHWSMEYTNLGICLKDVDTENIPDLSDFCTVGDFGCNRFERKEDEN